MRRVINVNQRPVPRHKTAIHRWKPSMPCCVAVATNVFLEGDTILDYGCGRGVDVAFLRRLGYDADGYDPIYAPDTAMRPGYNKVMLIYVLNVIEDPAERVRVLADAWSRAEDDLLVAVRVGRKQLKRARPMSDGYVTSIGTFQKFYRSREIEKLLREVTGRSPVRLVSGVYRVSRVR